MRDRAKAVLTRHHEYQEGSDSIAYSAKIVRIPKGLPGSGPLRPWLTFVQGYRQKLEYGLQAKFFSLRTEMPLVAASDLLVHCNNADMSQDTLVRYLSRYPHQRRALVSTADNSEGYRCGHLQAIASTTRVWAPYSAVVFMHPDIFLTPRASRWLESALLDETSGSNQTSRPPAFLVTEMRWIDGTRPVHTGGPAPQYFGTDLFAWRPVALRSPDSWHGICSAAHAPLKSYMPGTGQLRPSGGGANQVLPEQILSDFVTGPKAVVTDPKVLVLGARTTSTPGATEDRYGVVHSHDLEAVVRYLETESMKKTGGIGNFETTKPKPTSGASSSPRGGGASLPASPAYRKGQHGHPKASPKAPTPHAG